MHVLSNAKIRYIIAHVTGHIIFDYANYYDIVELWHDVKN